MAPSSIEIKGIKAFLLCWSPIYGSKNITMSALVASSLCCGTVALENMPLISDR